MDQLEKQDFGLASVVISNAGTRICFRLGDIDAKRLEGGFSFFKAQDLQNLGIGQAIVRIERPEYDFNLSTLELKDVEAEKGEPIKETVISLSREKYGTAREEVEKSLEYLRGEQGLPEKQTEVKEIKVAESVNPKKEIQESKKAQPLVEVPNLNEIQKTKTTENFVKQKELSQHRYLQTLIKKMAEARGYKASIEEPTPDGQGRVDVLLERGEKRIACEIGVTTSKEWEVHNIEKCLSAGYELVLAVSNTKDGISAMQKQANEKLDAEKLKRVLVMESEGLFGYLDSEIAKENTTETRMKGYRVKVEYDILSKNEIDQKRDALSKIILDSLRKMNT